MNKETQTFDYTRLRPAHDYAKQLLHSQYDYTLEEAVAVASDRFILTDDEFNEILEALRNG